MNGLRYLLSRISDLEGRIALLLDQQEIAAEKERERQAAESPRAEDASGETAPSSSGG